MMVQFVNTEVFPHGMAPSSENEALRVIESCGRTAYKSEDKITEDSAKAFVLMLKRHGHLSVLEHSNAVLKIEGRGEVDKAPSGGSWNAFAESLVGTLKERNAYHRVHCFSDPGYGLAISGNFRAWVETLICLQERNESYYRLLAHGLNRFYPNLFEVDSSAPGPGSRISLMSAEDQLNVLKEDPSSDLPVFIFKIVCDRGITHEIVRHRVLSFTQESTRYVNYKNKGMMLILPEELEPYYDAEKGGFIENDPLVDEWSTRAARIFDWYQEDVGRGRRPEMARDILPNLLKSEIFVSGRWSGWKHFILLRDSKQAHPRIRLIAQKVREYFETMGIVLPDPLMLPSE